MSRTEFAEKFTTHILCSITCPENRVVYGIIWKKTLVQHDRPKTRVQGGSVATGPKLFSIKNYVIEIMT